MADNEKTYYQLKRQISKIVDWKKIDNSFDQRFEEWWRLFEPYVERGLYHAEFVKKGKFKLEEWLAGGRKGFYSNLQSLFRAQMKGWISHDAMLLHKLDAIDENFDVQKHCNSVKLLMEGEQLNSALEKVFYVPLHAAALVLEIERRRQLLEKCRYECEKRDLNKYEMIPRKVKYEIVKAIGMKVDNYESFKSNKSKAYHIISKMLSELHYHRKRG